jgi:hypothetical protein
MLQQLPPKSPTPAPLTRIDHYLEHLQHSCQSLPQAVKYCAADGFYSKQKFVEGVVALDLHLISKLRSDADMRYLYTGQQKPRGDRRKYDGKVDLSELRRLTFMEQLEAGLNLYTAVVWHVSSSGKFALLTWSILVKLVKRGLPCCFPLMLSWMPN